MPSLGADMDRGTLVEWRVAVGDRVTRGDVVAVVDTDKSTIDVEVFETGVVDELVAAEDDEVPVGGVLARIRPDSPVQPSVPDTEASPVEPVEPVGSSEGEVEPTHPPPSSPQPPSPQPPSPHPPTPEPGPPIEPRPADTPGPRLSPRARRLAGATGVELGGVVGSGPGGTVTGDDLERLIASSGGGTADTPRPARRERLRQRVGSLMARSKRGIPHYYLAHTIDLRPATRWVAGHNERVPVGERVVMGAVIAAAVARAAAANRAMNGHWVDGRHVERDEVDLGMAVSLRGGGLLAPVIPDAARLGVPELMERLRTVVAGARSGNLPGWAMGEPTLTVTAMGDRGVDVVYGVIYPPQVAMVGVGVVAERPWVDGGLVVAAPCVTVSVAADHRASDGHDGARYVHAVAELLADPEVLAVPGEDPESAGSVVDPAVEEEPS